MHVSTKIDATERLLNLVIALLGTKRGHSKGYLRENINGYAAPAATAAGEASLQVSFERMFERDKTTLQELGIPISHADTEAMDGSEQVLYRIKAEEYQVPEIRLDEAAVTMLSIAANLWAEATLGEAAQSALRKISSRAGTGWYDDETTARSRIRTAEPSFHPLWTALRNHQPVTFSYRRAGATESRARTVQPWGLGNKYGQWYLAAFDVDKGVERNYRLSRITSEVRIDTAGTFLRPAGFSIISLLAQLGTGTPQSGLIAVPQGTAHWLRSRAGTEAATGTGWRREGWDVLRVSYREPELMADDAASLGAQALVLDPPTLRDAVVTRLSNAAQAAAAEPPKTVWDHPPATPRRKKSDSRDRLIRLLSMVPYLVANPGVSEAEVLAEFGITAKQWAKDKDTLNVTGLPGYFHGDLMDVTQEAGQIFIRDAETLARPLRLTQEEACSVLVGLQALSAVPGTAQADALAAAATSLSAVAGRDAWLADAVGLEIVDGADMEKIATLQGAIAEGRALQATYLVRNRDELTERRIDPYRLFSMDAAWYVRAWCHTAGELRSFRVDQFKTMHDAGPRVGGAGRQDVGQGGAGEPASGRAADHASGGAADPAGSAGHVYHPSPDDVPVELVADSVTAQRLAPAYNAELFDLGGGSVGLRLLVGQTAMLPGLMARLGGHAAVLAPESVRQECIDRLRDAVKAYIADGETAGGVPSNDG